MNYQDPTLQDPKIDSDLILNTSFMVKMDIELTEKELDSSHKTEVKKMPSELFGQTFTIHKKVSDFGVDPQGGKSKKMKTKKVHSISINMKQR